MKQRKIDSHNDAKATQKSSEASFVCELYIVSYDPYVRIYSNACKEFHGDPGGLRLLILQWEAIAMGYQNDVFLVTKVSVEPYLR